MVKDLKERFVEQGDTIALFVTAIIAIILVSVEILPERFVNISLLLILCLLALHHLRRTFRIEKMHKQIEEISRTVKTLRGTAKLLEEMGVLRIATRRSEIPIEEMHNEVKKANRVFILSRYFTTFANRTVQKTLLGCLKNGGIVQIVIYSPQGSHLNVEIEPDITPQEAKSKISLTLKRLRKFKQELPPDLQERFQYKILDEHIIYVWILGTSNKIFATTYLNDLMGDECPTIICKPLPDLSEDVYSIYSKEFERVWKVAKQPDQSEIAKRS